MFRKTLMLMVAATVAVAGAGMLAEDKPDQPDKPRRSGPGHKRSFKPSERARGDGLSAQKEEELLQGLKERMPDLYERLTKLREEDPDKYKAILRAMSQRNRRFVGMPPNVREYAQAEYEARLKIFRLLSAIRETTDETKLSGLKDELRSAVAERFDAEQKGRAERLAALEEQIKRLREDLKQRLASRDKIISERVSRWLAGGFHFGDRPPHRPDGPGQMPPGKHRPNGHRDRGGGPKRPPKGAPPLPAPQE